MGIEKEIIDNSGQSVSYHMVSDITLRDDLSLVSVKSYISKAHYEQGYSPCSIEQHTFQSELFADSDIFNLAEEAVRTLDKYKEEET